MLASASCPIYLLLAEAIAMTLDASTAPSRVSTLTAASKIDEGGSGDQTVSIDGHPAEASTGVRGFDPVDAGLGDSNAAAEGDCGNELGDHG